MKQLKLLFVGLLLVAANGLFAQITFTEGTFEEALALGDIYCTCRWIKIGNVWAVFFEVTY